VLEGKSVSSCCGQYIMDSVST